MLRPTNASCSSEEVFRSIPAYFNRVLNSREEGLFPVMDKSNFLQIFLKRSTSLLIWSETNILEMCLYEVSYIIVQYGNAWQEQPPNYLGYCDKVVHIVAKHATLLSEQFNWSHVIKTTNRKLGNCCFALTLKLSQHGPYRACCGSLTG